MNWIWLSLPIISLYFLTKYENKIGRDSGFYYGLLMFILLITGIILWDILGFDSGGGGSPYGDPDMYFNE